MVVRGRENNTQQTLRSKHGQVYKKMFRYIKTNNVMIKCLEVVAKCCLIWIFLSALSIVMLGTQI